MTILSHHILALPLACLIAALPSVAQEPGLALEPPPVLVTMSFPGGTMAEFVARIRAAEPRANIVVALDAATAALPPLELRGAGLEQALQAASIVVASDFTVVVCEFRGHGEPVYSLQAVATGTAQPSGGPKAPKVDESTQVFSLNRLTDDVGVDASGSRLGFAVPTILSAIEVGTQDGPKPPVLRYHRDSGLLIVRGSRAQLQLVRDILKNLENDIEARQRSSQRRKPTAVDPVQPNGK